MHGMDQTIPDALWDLFSLGMTGSLFSTSLSDLDSSSDHGFLFFVFLAGVPLGAGGFLTLGAPARRQMMLPDCFYLLWAAGILAPARSING